MKISSTDVIHNPICTCKHLYISSYTNTAIQLYKLIKTLQYKSAGKNVQSFPNTAKSIAMEKKQHPVGGKLNDQLASKGFNKAESSIGHYSNTTHNLLISSLYTGLNQFPAF